MVCNIGYAIHKLHNRLVAKKGDKVLIEIIRGCRGDENDMANSKMIEALNRGGLWCINENLQSILHIVEINFRKMMAQHMKIVEFDKFVSDSMKEPNVVFTYNEMNVNRHSDGHMKLALQLILELYVKVRLHSFARKKTEEAKLKMQSNKKGLRTELKRYENPIDSDIPE